MILLKNKSTLIVLIIVVFITNVMINWDPYFHN